MNRTMKESYLQILLLTSNRQLDSGNFDIVGSNRTANSKLVSDWIKKTDLWKDLPKDPTATQ